MSFQTIKSEDRRLQILKLLAEEIDYAQNLEVIKMSLTAVGHSVSHDQLSTELSWLEEQSLVELSDTAGLTIAKITTRGFDAAKGHAIIPGVRRPGP